MKTIVLTGGGTGGHVIPLLALVPELKKRFDRIIFIGGNGMEKALVENEGIPFFAVETEKFHRTQIYKNIKIPFALHRGIARCKEIFAEYNPSVLLSKGGYVALPACYAAKKSIPIVCHESDYTMGLANKLVSRFATKVLTSFEDTPGGTFVGNPVREEIKRGDKTSAAKKYPFLHSRKTVLFFGGSQGASCINNVIYDALPELTQKYNILHISGKNGDFSVPDGPGYHQIKFASDIFDLYALADMVVCRAGANTLFELASIGKPTLCIPLPKGTSRGDQVLNARYFRDKGFIDVLPQEDLFMESLLYKLKELEGLKPPVLDLSKTNERIADEVFSVAK